MKSAPQPESLVSMAAGPESRARKDVNLMPGPRTKVKLAAMFAPVLIVIMAVSGCFGGAQKKPSSTDIQQAVRDELRTPDMTQMIQQSVTQDQLATALRSPEFQKQLQQALVTALSQQDVKKNLEKTVQGLMSSPDLQATMTNIANQALSQMLMKAAASAGGGGGAGGGKSGGGGGASGGGAGGG